jgi:hypothetical protein
MTQELKTTALLSSQLERREQAGLQPLSQQERERRQKTNQKFLSYIPSEANMKLSNQLKSLKMEVR